MSDNGEKTTPVTPDEIALDETKPSFLSRFLLPLIILAAGAGVFGLLWSMQQTPEEKKVEPAVTLVNTVPLKDSGNSFFINVNGTVVPKYEVSLAAEVAGRVMALGDEEEEFAEPVLAESPRSRDDDRALRAGMFVSAGALLVTIDRRTYDLEVAKLDSESKQAEVDLQQLEKEKTNQQSLRTIALLEQRLAQSELDRVDRLVKGGRLNQSQLDEAKRQVARADNALQTIDNALALIPTRREKLLAQQKLIAARLELARLDLEKTTIRAPISGVISGLSVEENDFVQRGTALLKIEDRSVVEVTCNLRTDDLYWLWTSVDKEADKEAIGRAVGGGRELEIPHARATISYTVAGRTYQWDGFLSRFKGEGIDPRTRTIPCLVEVPHPSRWRTGKDLRGSGRPSLLRGMFVQVALQVKPKVPLLRLPARALQPRNRVYTVKEGKLQIHEVDVARLLSDAVFVRRDEKTKLKVGDRVVVSPLAMAVEGMPVKEEEKAKPEGKKSDEE